MKHLPIVFLPNRTKNPNVFIATRTVSWQTEQHYQLWITTSVVPLTEHAHTLVGIKLHVWYMLSKHRSQESLNDAWQYAIEHGESKPPRGYMQACAMRRHHAANQTQTLQTTLQPVTGATSINTQIPGVKLEWREITTNNTNRYKYYIYVSNINVRLKWTLLSKHATYEGAIDAWNYAIIHGDEPPPKGYLSSLAAKRRHKRNANGNLPLNNASNTQQHPERD